MLLPQARRGEQCSQRGGTLRTPLIAAACSPPYGTLSPLWHDASQPKCHLDRCACRRAQRLVVCPESDHREAFKDLDASAFGHR